jgi:hypothetical protein
MVILIISRLLGQVAHRKGIQQRVSFFLRVVKRKTEQKPINHMGVTPYKNVFERMV